jgi:tight adherence protein B
VTALALALVAAIGVALIWAGLATDAGEWLGLRVARLRRSEGSGAIVGRSLAGVAGAGVAAGLAWWLTGLPALAVVAASAGFYAPFLRRRKALGEEARAREHAWPGALAQLADALEAGLGFQAAVGFVAASGSCPLRPELRALHGRIRAGELEAGLADLADSAERTAQTVGALLRAAVVELPSGRLAPLLRDLAQVLVERYEAREKARSRASSLRLEAAVLALSPIVLLVLIGTSSPGYLDAYRSASGTAVSLVAGGVIFGCYLLMLRLGRVPEPRASRSRR